MPTSSSLVTNLPADFNTFGQAVDTSMSELLGGTTGQVLSKTSATNMDFTWVTPTDQTPLTTKGDLFTFSTVDARLAVGTNKYVLGADSTQSTGLAWQTSPQSIMTTTGDTLYASAANTPARLGIGSTGNVLTVAGGVPTWAAPAGGGKLLQVVTATTSTAVTIASATMTDSGITATITPTLNTSKIYVIISVSVTFGSSSVDVYVNGALKRGATTVLDMTGSNFLASDNGVYRRDMNSVTYVDSPATTSATTYKFQGAVSSTASGRQVIFQPASGTSVITLLEIGA